MESDWREKVYRNEKRKDGTFGGMPRSLSRYIAEREEGRSRMVQKVGRKKAVESQGGER